MSHLAKVDHDFIRYANVWEDAAVLRAGLNIEPGEKVLSIASAGDNCFALLLDDPSLIVTCDINQVQLHLLQLKMAAIRQLDYDKLKFFLGFTGKGDHVARLEIFRQLKNAMEPEAAVYFQENPQLLENGIIHNGKFERYFQYFVKYLLPLVHSRRETNELLAVKSTADQQEYFDRHWNSARWRFFFRFFFSRSIMGLLGRDPAFLKEMKGSVSEFILAQAATHLRTPAAQNNFMLHYNLKADFGDLLPDYISSEEHIRLIRSRLDRIRPLHGLIQEAGSDGTKFDAMNLSDIFEYMPDTQFRNIAAELANMSNSGARLAYWNLMVDRDLSLIAPVAFADGPKEDMLPVADRGFYYKRFLVSVKKSC